MSAKKGLALPSGTLVLSRGGLWKRELNIRDSEKRVNFRNVGLNHSDWFYDSEWELFEIPGNDIFNRKNPYDLPKGCSLYIEVTFDTKLGVSIWTAMSQIEWDMIMDTPRELVKEVISWYEVSELNQ